MNENPSVGSCDMFKMADEGRRDEAEFFIYDHNLLKKEEDDLIDAILYFSPENVSDDDQCALCGQLMGMAEFLTATLGKSSPKIFKFEHEKFAIKRVGGYSLGLQCKRNDPDSVVLKQLDYLYGIFITFHGSLNSLRLRCKDSNNNFSQDLRNIWRTILNISDVSLQLNLSKTFHHLPYIQLPKTGSHLYLQASQLLQSSQRRPYVLGGAILYKNEVVCTQLPPTLTRQLTYLQVKMPYIEKKMDFELPVGCKICTLFLTDEELLHIFPLDQFARRHCKITDFTSRRESDVSPKMAAKSAQSKQSGRRQTCPNIASSLHLYDSMSDHVVKQSDQGLPSLLDNIGKGSFKKNSNFIGVDRHSGWGKGRSKISLSHVPIVECRHGESPADSATETLTDNADDSYFGKSYRSSTLNEPYNPLNLDSLKADINDSDNDSEDDLGLVDTEKDSADDQNKSQSTDMPDKESSSIHKLGASNTSESETSQNSDAVNTKTMQENLIPNDALPMNNDKLGAKHSNLTKKNGLNFKRNFSDSDLDVQENDIGATIQVSVEVHEQNTNMKPEVNNCDSVSKTVTKVENDNKLERGISEYTDENETNSQTKTVNGASVKSTADDKAILESDKCQNTDLEHHVSDDEKENINPSNVSGNKDSSFRPKETLDLNEFDEPCIGCLELRTENPEGESSKQKCVQCLSKKKSQIINHFADRKEVIDFTVRCEHQDTSANQIIDASDTEQISQSMISNETFTSSTLTFSSSVSTDSTISRFWTHEMEGLNDVTVYIQCHSDISLLLLMENPDQYQETLLHSIWKGSLHHLADLDFYIKECLEQDENALTEHYSFVQYNKFSRDFKENVGESSAKKKGPFKDIVAALHAEFDYHPALNELTLRNQAYSCYGHHSEVNETFFQLDGPIRLTSGLPVSKDPNYMLDSVAKTKLAKDRHISLT